LGQVSIPVALPNYYEHYLAVTTETGRLYPDYEKYSHNPHYRLLMIPSLPLHHTMFLLA
uniref:JmjC domain-containing protein n=1 Tax=Brugia timori TaxID=42155 RepID=A0A0R3QGU3_9BILA